MIALLLAAFGLGISSVGAASAAGEAYSYDSSDRTATITTAMTDRLPPATTHDSAVTRAAVDRRSNGAWARADAARNSSYTTYDAVALLAHFDEGIGTAARVATGPKADHSLIDRSQVAAKTADDSPVISGIVRDASKNKGNYEPDSLLRATHLIRTCCAVIRSAEGVSPVERGNWL